MRFNDCVAAAEVMVREIKTQQQNNISNRIESDFNFLEGKTEKVENESRTK